MNKSILIGFLLYSQLSAASRSSQFNIIYDTAQEAIEAVSQKIASGIYSGHTPGKKICQMHVEYYSFAKQGLISFLIKSPDADNPQPVVVTITGNKNLVSPTSEMISGQKTTLVDGTEKFIFGILSGGNTEKYLSLEIGPTEISVFCRTDFKRQIFLGREGYILDPVTPRILCLDMKTIKNK